MSWILSVVIVVLVGLSVGECANLAAMKWQRGVNTLASFEKALKSKLTFINYVI